MTAQTNSYIIGLNPTADNNFLLDTDSAGALRIRRRADGSGGTLLVMNTPNATIQQSWLTAAKTAVGANVDFAAASSDAPPSWANKITVNLSGLSLTGNDHLLLQLGVTSAQTTGYSSQASNITTGPAISTGSFTAGFGVLLGGATATISGQLFLTRLSALKWLMSTNITRTDGAIFNLGGGEVTLAGNLGFLRLIPSGANTIDAGTVSAFYEG